MRKTLHSSMFAALALFFWQAPPAAAQHRTAAAPQVRERFITPPLQSPPQMTPQFNDPGPQYVPPVPSNPLDQSTLPNASQTPDSLGIK
jgi:hypothetical protein